MKLTRKLYWAWPSHLKEGVTLYLNHKKFRPGMVRIRIELVESKPKKRKAK